MLSMSRLAAWCWVLSSGSHGSGDARRVESLSQGCCRTRGGDEKTPG